jgi:hypothetical protein
MAKSSKSVAPRRSARAEFWRRLIADCAKSGLTQSAFCAARGVSAVTMSWWRSQLRTRDAKAAKLRASQRSRRRRPSRFVALTVRPAPAPPAPTSRIEIALAHGRLVRLAGSVDPVELRSIVSVLESTPAPC